MGPDARQGARAGEWSCELSMADIFLERGFDSPLTIESVADAARRSKAAFSQHDIHWNCCFLSSDGRRTLCWFEAPDAESARAGLGQFGVDVSALWPGTCHDAPQPAPANVAVVRTFDSAVTLEEIQAIEDAGAWCLETHRVKFVRTFFSLDKKRMVCLYNAPDAESVRLAQREARMPFEEVWACRTILPAALAAAD